MAWKAVSIFALFGITFLSNAQTIYNQFVIDSCSMIYDIYDEDAKSTRINPALSEAEWEKCVTITDGVCDCDETFFLFVFRDSYSQSGNNNSFAMSTNSILDYTISFTTTDVVYMDSFYQYWQDYGDRPGEVNGSSFVEFVSSSGDTYNVSYSISYDPSEGAFLQAQDSSLDEIPIDKIHVHLVFLNTSADTSITNGGGKDDIVLIDSILVLGADATKNPTSDPTESPSPGPTHVPTGFPTSVPSEVPTKAPTTDPTSAPTMSPTWHSVEAKTIRDSDSYQLWSDNVYPLANRTDRLSGELEYFTSTNYTLPDIQLASGTWKYGEDRAYCAFCILAWADLDATIELEGCDNYNINSFDPADEDSFYWCDDGEWYVVIVLSM